MTLDGSLTLSGPQCPLLLKVKVELGDPKALHATNLHLVWVGPGKKQMACL